MSTALAPRSATPNAPRMTREQVDLLKRTVCRGSSDDEFKLFLYVCERTGLDPFVRQIYAVRRWNSQTKREEMTIQTGIDGYRLVAERTQRYSPGRQSTYEYDERGGLKSATAYIKKMTPDGTWHEVAATARHEEYAQYKRDGGLTAFWSSKPHIMLDKCAEALALRKAFPHELSGVYVDEEMPPAETTARAVAEAEIVSAEPPQSTAVADPETGGLALPPVDDATDTVTDIREKVDELIGRKPGTKYTQAQIMAARNKLQELTGHRHLTGLTADQLREAGEKVTAAYGAWKLS